MLTLPSHVGAFPDHDPPSSHILVSDPLNAYPSLQLYVAIEPILVPADNSTFPFSGTVSDGHSNGASINDDNKLHV